MQVNVRIGQNHHFALHEALLIYRSTEHQNGSFGNTFITHHEVNAETRTKQPTLGPAKTLTIEFVQSLVQALGGRVQAEFLPASVIARTERLIAWWTRPQKRPMFFGTTQGDMAGMNGAIFPQPALVWLAITRSRSGRSRRIAAPRPRPSFVWLPTGMCTTRGASALARCGLPMPPPSPQFPNGSGASTKASLRMATWGGLRAILAASKDSGRNSKAEKTFPPTR